MIITLVVTFCMTLNPTMCRELEMVPSGRTMVSVPECLKGGAIGSMSFQLDHIEWYTRGWRCEERPNVVAEWRKKWP